MHFNLLIDAIVRQTTVLIAQLSTAGGGRAPLSHVANQVFLDLVHELKTQGLSNKVIADMFGLALRTYHNKLRRLSESQTDRGRSLWEAVYGFVRDGSESKRALARAAILARFHRDDAANVGGVLNDLVGSGLLFRTGNGERSHYRAAELTDGIEPDDLLDSAAAMLLVVLSRANTLSEQELREAMPIEPATLDAALRSLLSSGRAVALGTSDAPKYRADSCIIPFGDAHGWEAAVFDHFQAMATAIAAKVRSGRTRADLREVSGGSTYHFDVYRDHPLEEQVLSLLEQVRSLASQLRERVDAFNREQPIPAHVELARVTFYVGQHAPGARAEGDEGEP
jgi:hypothetical protein